MDTTVPTVAAPTINRRVLMTGAQYFSIKELNPYSHATDQPNVSVTVQEHTAIMEALRSAGVDIDRYPDPVGCQDGVYTANWALCLDGQAILSNLPGPRQGEQPHAEAALTERGFQVVRPPYRFSGQGDALPAGRYLFCGQTYRTDPRMHQWLAEHTGREVVSLQAIPQLDRDGQPVINHVTGWPDSFFYDIDLALAVLRANLIAWCPEAFDQASQAKIRALHDLEQIEVTLDEARHGFACNLVSTGSVVVMSDKAPKLQAAIEEYGLQTITPPVTELAKGGGYIRCTTLTLENP